MMCTSDWQRKSVGRKKLQKKSNESQVQHQPDWLLSGKQEKSKTVWDQEVK